MIESLRASTDVWMQTASGRQVFLLAPTHEQIDIDDIAHQLAMQCRWVGATRAFYSVAQHSVLVAGLVPPPYRLWGLLHDASEAYLGDVNSRFKQSAPMSGYRAVEGHLQQVIFHCFGLHGPLPEEVRMADLQLLACESRDLLVKPVPTAYAPPAKFRITETWDPSRAKANFLLAFEKLKVLP